MPTTVTLELWQFVTGMAVLATAIAWLVNLFGRQSAHEDLCAQRYQQIADTHRQLVKVSDERHEENLGRFTRLENKLDTLLER